MAASIITWVNELIVLTSSSRNNVPMATCRRITKRSQSRSPGLSLVAHRKIHRMSDWHVSDPWFYQDSWGASMITDDGSTKSHMAINALSSGFRDTVVRWHYSELAGQSISHRMSRTDFHRYAVMSGAAGRASYLEVRSSLYLFLKWKISSAIKSRAISSSPAHPNQIASNKVE